MRIFLSYASEDRPRAEDIALALEAAGHDVFFDRTALDGGEDYHRVIRERIAAADLLIFLISPAAVRPGAYTLTELRMAQERWPSPVGRVLPVLIAPTALERVPAYPRAVTIFEPHGNAAAEIVAHLERAGRCRPRWWLAIAALVLIGLGGWLYARTQGAGSAGFVSTIAESDFVTAFVMPTEQLERTDFALDPTARFAAERGDVVRLERLAFGRLADGAKAFSVGVSVTNTTDQPIQLDLTPRFFELGDDRGRRAELLYFCCEARGDLLAPGEQRQLKLIYRAVPGWEGKETSAGMIHFRIAGLLPVVRATWSFRPLATAA